MAKRLANPEYEALKRDYFSGWKTWNVNSVLSYVHMPDALTLRLSVREYQSGHYLPDALIGQFPDPAGLWDEQIGFFCNRRTDNGEFSHRLSPTNFYALYSDRISPEQIRRILQEHYYNEEEFYGEWMLPSIARSDPAFAEQDYWRGRVWAPLNFLTYLAFKHQGCEEECADLAEKSRYIFQKEWDEHRHVHENYNAISGEGCDAKNSDKFYHWGALMSVIALMEAGLTGNLDMFF